MPFAPESSLESREELLRVIAIMSLSRPISASRCLVPGAAVQRAAGPASEMFLGGDDDPHGGAGGSIIIINRIALVPAH